LVSQSMQALWSIELESVSQLARVEVDNFVQSGLNSIVIASSVEILRQHCFSQCELLSLLMSECVSRWSSP
jgi:hypothetical protein